MKNSIRMSIPSLSLSLLLIPLITLPTTAQIQLDDEGRVGILTEPGIHKALEIRCDNCAGENIPNYGIYSMTFNAPDDGWGLWNFVSADEMSYGVQTQANSDDATAYGIHASASGHTSSWAGYFEGDVYTTGSYLGSDERFKRDIRSVDGSEALDRLQQIQPRRYYYLSEDELQQAGMPSFDAKEGQHLGVIAQELDEVFPELVISKHALLGDANQEPGDIEREHESVKTQAVNYNGLIIALIAAVQEQQERIEELEQQIQQ